MDLCPNTSDDWAMEAYFGRQRQSRGLVVVLGWSGSRTKHFAPVVDWYASRGFRCVTHTSNTVRGLVRLSEWTAEIDRFAATVVSAHEVDHTPTIVHLFSSNGFLACSLLLERLAALPRGESVLDSLKGFIFDSSPGFSLAGGRRAYVDTMVRGFVPWTLLQLRHRVADSASLAALWRGVMNAHWVLVPSIARVIGGCAERFVAHRPPVPQLYLYGGRDAVVLPERVEAFSQSEGGRGITVQRMLWPDSGHVQHFKRHSEAYFDALKAFVISAFCI